MLMTGLIYPVVVGWCWGGGWLGDKNEAGKGFHDFAGSGVVHMVGGTAGFIGARIIGPRYGKDMRNIMRKNVLDEKESKDWILK
jgi:Amt family ammonium transporter